MAFNCIKIRDKSCCSGHWTLTPIWQIASRLGKSCSHCCGHSLLMISTMILANTSFRWHGSSSIEAVPCSKGMAVNEPLEQYHMAQGHWQHHEPQSDSASWLVKYPGQKQFVDKRCSPFGQLHCRTENWPYCIRHAIISCKSVHFVFI